jgi:ankyrin repeat protein
MSQRELPARPDLDHLKNEAKALRAAFMSGDAGAVARVLVAIGPTTELKLTEAQRVLAREYGFRSWALLRSRVLASRGVTDAVDAFLAAVAEQDRGRALQVLKTEPRIAEESLHVAAVLGQRRTVRDRLVRDPSSVGERAGKPPAEPLLWLCYSPFHGESAERDRGLLACARALLAAGANPNTTDGRYGVPALYAVVGPRWVPEIARVLLTAGANPTDGESVFHAAESFHEEALELLLRHGADLNATGEWGNTPLYFLLRYHDLEREPDVARGLRWLLAHGADPNVRCGRERETSVHMAARSGQNVEIVKLLLEHGADVHALRGDGRTAWVLARRSGFDDVAAALEEAGARPEPLSSSDALMRACSRGDVEEATQLTSPQLVASLVPADLWVLPTAAFRNRLDVIEACLAAGVPIDTPDEFGATALHHASIRGRAPIVRELLRSGADFRIHDSQHDAPPLGWACFGADMVSEPGGDYEDTVRALLEAGARPTAADRLPQHEGVRAVLQSYAK